MNSKAGNRRVFFALLPEGDTINGLTAAHQRLQQLCDRGERMVQLDNLHITLAFIGSINALGVEVLKEIAASISSTVFTLDIDSQGWWKKPGLFWLGPSHTPAGLQSLVRQLQKHLAARKFQIEKRKYIPHITMVRKVSQPILDFEFGPFSWHASHFCLMESVLMPGDVNYREIACWSLE